MWKGQVRGNLALASELGYFLVADVQALTTHGDQPDEVHRFVREVVLDWLSVGIDPDQCRFVLQSQVPELGELTLYLQLLARTGELRENPAVRREARSLGKGNLDQGLNDIDFGFLGYPVSQVADILLFTPSPPGPDDRLVVPVGEDQLPHIGFARELARRFNDTYGEVFLEPQARTDSIARLPGTDGGSKMGTTRNNAVFLGESDADVARKIGGMFTDPLRVHHGDPGHPDDCPCNLFRTVFGAEPEAQRERYEDCLLGRADCADCKLDLVDEVITFLRPIRERRALFEADPDLVKEALTAGTRRAREVARATMKRVREAMRLHYPDLIRAETDA